MRMSNLIIFDMDDTLVGTHDLISASFAHAIAEYSRPRSSENVAMISGYSLSCILLQSVPSDYLGEALERYHEYFETHFDQSAQIYQSLKVTLTRLRKKGIDLAVLTGANRKWTEITLRESGLTSFFSVVLTSDDVKVPKPDPAGLIAIVTKLGAKTECTAYVGDEVKDIRSSRNAGVRAVGALWGSWEREKLKSAEPDVILNEPIDLLRSKLVIGQSPE